MTPLWGGNAREQHCFNLKFMHLTKLVHTKSQTEVRCPRAASLQILLPVYEIVLYCIRSLFLNYAD